MRFAISRFLQIAVVVLACSPATGYMQVAPTPVPATRTALLMGVWDYKDETFPALPAKGIRSDLQEMQAKLKELGFQEVTVVENPTVAEAERAVDAFGVRIKERGGATLFYFTGHGAEEGGKNYLIPVGTNVQDSADLKAEALAADRILSRMESSGNRVNLVFLDCCRNALTKAGGDTGLAAMSAKGALIGFATRSGDVADASDEGSPYTKALVKHLGQRGVSLSDMHTLVTRELEQIGSKRRPGQYVDLGDIFHLVPISVLNQGSIGKVVQITLKEDVLMKFCYCPSGSFLMGHPKGKGRWWGGEQVAVSISKGYWTGQMEVTQAQWTALMGANPSIFVGDNLPVENISWEDARAFVSMLNQSMKLPDGWKFSMLTEAQWEYSCRAGTQSTFAYGERLLGSMANIGGGETRLASRRSRLGFSETTLVGSFPPNRWGLHDVHGNVSEWCLDAWHGSDQLVGGVDPVGTVGSRRVLRGGSWLDVGWVLECAFRYPTDPSYRSYGLGLRVAIVPADS